jgi:hypothetical protein
MKLKIVLCSLAALFAMAVPAGALDPLGESWAPDVRCEDFSATEMLEAHGAPSATFPTGNPNVPFVTVDLLCVTSLIDDVSPATDCTAKAYSVTGWHWATPYNNQWDTSNPFGISSSSVLSASSASGNTWDQAVAADIYGSATSGGSAGNIRHQDFVNQMGFKNLGGGGTIAVTYTWQYSDGRAAESDAAFNTFFAWGTNGGSNVMDLQGIATHEIGHTFGMGHTSTASANSCLTMYPYGNYGQTYQRTLGDGDLLGIDAIY